MSTFTKKTIIVWQRASYDSLSALGTLESPNTLAEEFHAKKDEMIESGKMSEEWGGFCNDITGEATQFRKFIDQESAQEWIDFNSTFATTHNLTIISTEIKSI